MEKKKKIVWILLPVLWIFLLLVLMLLLFNSTSSVTGATGYYGPRIENKKMDVCTIPVHLEIGSYVLVRPIRESVTVTIPAGSYQGSYSGDLFFVYANCPAIARIEIIPRAGSIKDVKWEAKIQIDKGDPLDQEIVLPISKGVEVLTTVKADFKNINQVLAYQSGEYKKQADLVLTIFPAAP